MPPLRTPSCMWDGTCVAHERWSAQGLCTPDSTRGCAHTHPWCHPTRRAGGGGHHLPGSGTSLQVLIFRIGHMVQPALHTPNLKFRFLNFLSLCIFMNKINYKTNKNKAKQCINNNVSPCICETHGKIIRHHPSSSHFHSLAATSPLCGKTHTHRGVQRGWGASIPPPPPRCRMAPTSAPPLLGPCWCPPPSMCRDHATSPLHTNRGRRAVCKGYAPCPFGPSPLMTCTGQGARNAPPLLRF
jgi:hypothetical protein